ncbi:MAG: Ig-like domain-containing protein [Methanobacteriota archaeon]|nr:MAG: Ig-like domain-containing protein [Euryarchaeota archaeon]
MVTASILVYTYYPREEYKVLPRVVDFAPSGYGTSTGAEIIVTFNKAMDIHSVETSFSVSPSIAGSFAWAGITMTYTPSGALMDLTYYTATIGQGAKDLDGSQLDCVMFSWSFFTGEIPTERRDVGTGAEDFWIGYPPTHPSSGETVQHPDYVLSALDSDVVMILDHSEGCAPCIQQGTICQSVSAANPDITYFDLSSGTDEPEASQAFAAYDPNGGVHYVPLTIVVTRVQSPAGGTAVGWHAWEGVIDLDSLQSWILDAKSHYDENS